MLPGVIVSAQELGKDRDNAAFGVRGRDGARPGEYFGMTVRHRERETGGVQQFQVVQVVAERGGLFPGDPQFALQTSDGIPLIHADSHDVDPVLA